MISQISDYQQSVARPPPEVLLIASALLVVADLPVSLLSETQLKDDRI